MQPAHCVQADNRIRAWYMSNMAVGLLYECNLGDIKPDCPVGERMPLPVTEPGLRLLISCYPFDACHWSTDGIMRYGSISVQQRP